MSELRAVIADFTSRLSTLIESQAVARARASVLAAFNGGAAVAPKRPGRPPKALNAFTSSAPPLSPTKVMKRRKKAPLQLCPVPGCKNPAAPIFGMVCSKHKDLPKAKIKKFRKARRAKKLAGSARPRKTRARRIISSAKKTAKMTAKMTRRTSRKTGPAKAATPASATSAATPATT